MTTLDEQLQMARDVVYGPQPSNAGPAFFLPPSSDQFQAWERAIGGGGWARYNADDISDVVNQGAVYDPRSGQTQGSSSYADGAMKVKEAYEKFTQTHAGSKMVQQMGVPQWDGYAMLDLPGSAMGATITYKENGRRILAANSKYTALLDAGMLAGPHLEEAIMNAIHKYGHPLGDELVAHAANFYEMMYHESRHYAHVNKIFNRSTAEEEYETYMETAQFYQNLANEVKDKSYAMGTFYEAIAKSSAKKAELYKDGATSHVHAHDLDYHAQDLEGIAAEADGLSELESSAIN